MTLIELLREYRVPYRDSGTKHSTPGWLQIDCPDCGKNSQSWHLGIREDYQRANCWRCGPKHYAGVLAELAGISPKQIYALLSLSERKVFRPQERRCGAYTPPRGLGPLQHQHIKYLKQRGFDAEEIERLWGVQGIGLSSKLSWRLFIPIRVGSESVSWTTRSVEKYSEQRYITAKPEQESQSSRSVLYGAEMVRATTVIVVEGPTDVWAIGPGAVAVMGLAYSKSQVAKIASYARRYVCFDSQSVARKASRRLCNDLQSLPGETYNVTLTGKDAASSPREELEALRELVRGG